MTSPLMMRRRAMGKSGPLASDAFNRPDGALNGSTADTGQVWTAHASFVIAANQLTTNAAQNMTASVPTGVTDQYVSAVVAALTTLNYAGVAARYTDASNFYFADVGVNGDARLFKLVANAFTSLGTLPAGSFVAGNRLALRVVGSSLAVYKNDVATGLAATDTALVSGDRAGVWFNLADGNARFDDFSVTVP